MTYLPLAALALILAGCCSIRAASFTSPVDRIDSEVFIHIGNRPNCPVDMPDPNVDAGFCPGEAIRISLYAGFAGEILRPKVGQIVALELVEFSGRSEQANFEPEVVQADVEGWSESNMRVATDIVGVFRVRGTFPDGHTQSVTYSRLIRISNQFCLTQRNAIQ